MSHMPHADKRPAAFVIPCGAGIDIDNKSGTLWIKVVADPHPLVLECITDDPLHCRLHIIGSSWTHVAVESNVRLFRVVNPLCNYAESTLGISPSHGGNGMMLQGTEVDDVSINPREVRSIFSIDRFMPRPHLSQAARVTRPLVDVQIHLLVSIQTRPKLFASFDKITVNYYRGEDVFFQKILSVGQGLYLSVHNSPTTKLDDTMDHSVGYVAFHNPWPFDTKILKIKTFGTAGKA